MKVLLCYFTIFLFSYVGAQIQWQNIHINETCEDLNKTTNTRKESGSKYAYFDANLLKYIYDNDKKYYVYLSNYTQQCKWKNDWRIGKIFSNDKNDNDIREIPYRQTPSDTNDINRLPVSDVETDAQILHCTPTMRFISLYSVTLYEAKLPQLQAMWEGQGCASYRVIRS